MTELKEKVQFLEQQILKLSSSISEGEETETAKMLKVYNLILKNLYEERSRSASIWGKISSWILQQLFFFFFLEKNINHLKLSN